MRRNSSREIRSIANTLNNTRHKRSAVQLAHFLGHANVLVHEGLVIDDVVFVWCFRVGGFLESVCLAVEEVLPDVLLDEV